MTTNIQPVINENTPWLSDLDIYQIEMSKITGVPQGYIEIF